MFHDGQHYSLYMWLKLLPNLVRQLRQSEFRVNFRSVMFLNSWVVIQRVAWIWHEHLQYYAHSFYRLYIFRPSHLEHEIDRRRVSHTPIIISPDWFRGQPKTNEHRHFIVRPSSHRWSTKHHVLVLLDISIVNSTCEPRSWNLFYLRNTDMEYYNAFWYFLFFWCH